MKRRALLQRTAALAAAGSIAGCLAGRPGGQPGDATTRTTTTRRSTTDAATSTTTTPDRPDEPFETMRVGSRDGVLDPENNRPHAVRVTNDADEPRTIGVQFRATGESALVESDSWKLPARARVEAELLTPADYEVVVSVGGETAGTVEVGRSWFDCNGSATNVAVTPDGGVESESISTAMGCPPSVRDASLRVTDGRCWSEGSDGSTESASVAFGDGALELTGTFEVPSPDYGLAVAGVERAEVDGEYAVVVTVATTEAGERGGGMQCVGALDYEATLAFDGGLPARVAVRHGSGEDAVAVVDRPTTTDGS